MGRIGYGTLAVLGALGLLALVVRLAGPKETLDALGRLDAWQAVLLVLTAFGVSFFTALAWRETLLQYGQAVSVGLLFELTVLAFAVGWIVPSGFVAGIPAAAWFLRQRGVPFMQGLASFGIGRFFEITAYVLILPIVLLSSLGSRTLVRAAAGVVLGGLFLVYLDLFLQTRLARRGLAALQRLVPRLAHPPLEHAASFCATVADFFRAPARIVALVMLYSFVAIGVAYFRSWLTSRFLGLDLSPPQLAVMLALTIFLMAIPFLPGAIGAFEGGIAGAFELLGRDKADGLAFAMTIHATELVVVVAGVLVLVHLGIRPSELRPPAAAAACDASGPRAGAARGGVRRRPRESR